MKMAVARVFLILFITVFASGCIAPVRLKDAWRDPQAPPTVYKKLLVVMVAHNRDLREMLENISVTTLDEHGVAAVQSHRLIGDLKQDDAKPIQALSQSVGADAVVVTHAISKSEHTDYRYFDGTLQARTVVVAEQNENSTSVLAMSAVGIAPRETDFVHGYLQTRLFDVASAKLVWLAHSSVISDGNRGDACWEFSMLLAKALAKDKLITINDREFKKPSL